MNDSDLSLLCLKDSTDSYPLLPLECSIILNMAASVSDKLKTESLFQFSDVRPVPDIFHNYTRDQRNSKPIVIDNGSFQCRAGWASDDKPRLIFKNIIVKQRGKKDSEVQIGNDVSNIEVVRWSMKTQFDHNVVTQYQAQEQIFDYIFSHLGIDTEECVDHPIVLTEPVCNPSHCRSLMNELLFECYSVPKIALGIDALFSYYKNFARPERTDGMIISCGYHTVHLLPILNGRMDAQNCRRINIGGSHVNSFMHRLMQLKYPAHFAAVTLSRCEELVHKHTYLAIDYETDLDLWADTNNYERHVHKIQLPYTPLPGGNLSVEAQKERKQQQIKRLQEMNAKRREEKLVSETEKLQQLISIQELMEDEDEDSFMRALDEMGFCTADELQQCMNKLRASIQRTKNRILGIENDNLEEKDEPKVKRFREDTEINKMLESKQRMELNNWLHLVRKKREALLETRAHRRQHKADMAKRRTFASQQRMKIISQLAESNAKLLLGSKKEDTFGQNDEDWNVYKSIDKEGGDTDSEEEQEQLQDLEQLLIEHDPEFQREKEANQELNFNFNVAEFYQLQLGVEQIRVPELLFQPSMMGAEQAGIAETLEYILKKYSADDQHRLVQNIFLMGGNTLFPNFHHRMENELLKMRPFQSTFKIFRARDPIYDAWSGACLWGQNKYNQANYFISKADYLEKGEDYLKEHFASNVYIPTPSPGVIKPT